LQRCCDLYAHKILRVIQTAGSVFSTHVKPVAPDYCEQHPASRDLLAQDLVEIIPRGNVIHIDKREIAPKLAFQPFVDQAGIGCTVFPAVTDENRGRHHALL
jgi:hypothetical protein